MAGPLQIFSLPSFQQIIQYVNGPATAQGTGVLGPLEPVLIQFMRNTDLQLAINNPVVKDTWIAMLAAANAFFLLFVLLGAIQILLANSTGVLSIPISQFVPKVILTGLLMNLSYFLCGQLLIFNNWLCDLVDANLNTFFDTLNQGSRITDAQGGVYTLVLIVLLNVGLMRLFFQTIERLVLWILLFVLSPLAFLSTFLPQTASFFTYWARMFVVVTFTQFAQFLALSLSLALLANAGSQGLSGFLVKFLLFAAMLFLVAKIPDLLSRFPSMAVSNSQGIGHLVGTLLIAARLLTI